MAHSPTRLEGFESGVNVQTLNGDTNTGGVVQSTIKRTGDYALRTQNDGVSAAFSRLALEFDTVSALYGGKTSTTQLRAAASYRVYIYIATYPSTNGVQVIALTTHTNTKKSIVNMSTTGVLTLDGIAGSTVIPLATWTRIDCIYDSTSTGTVSLRINGTQEFGGVTPTSNGTVGRIELGKTATPGSYDIYWDDVHLEAAAAVASLDYPLPGGVIPFDVDGDGGEDGAFAPTPAGLASATLVRPHDGDTSFIAVSGLGVRRQTCTIETVSGLPTTINAVQLSTYVSETGAADKRLLLRSGGVNNELTSTATNAAGYNLLGSLRRLSPFTGLAWTLAELESLEIGLYASPGAGTLVRCSTMFLLVDAEIETSGQGVNTTYLEQLAFLTGNLNSITNYSPHIQTVQLTSEAFGESNKAFNIVACTVRYIPNGNELVHGFWFFDKNATSGFNLDSNPMERTLLGPTTTTSTFTFNSSTMLDNREVYSQFIQLGGSGKFFQMDLVQTGSRKMDILALEFEVKIEGRREAYLYGSY